MELCQLRRVNAIGTILCVYLLVAWQPIWAQSCKDMFGGYGVSVQTPAQWGHQLNQFLSSPSPHYPSIESIMRLLEGRDTSRLETRHELQSLAEVVQRHAKQLIRESPSTHATESQLLSTSNKLRLLNVPSLRNLLPSDTQSLIGQTAWIYNRSLWSKNKSISEKIKAIQEELQQRRIPSSVALGPVARVGGDLEVRAVSGDMFLIPGDARIVTIDSDGLCDSGIHRVLPEAAKTHLASRAGSLQDNDVLIFQPPTTRKNDKQSFVFVVDDRLSPLHRLILSALRLAEKEGFTSVALPVFRTGDAFGAVETSTHQIIHEILSAVSIFQKESTGKLKTITFSVRNNEGLLRDLQDKIVEAKTARERSLRNDLREAKLSGQGFNLAPSKNRPKTVDQSSPIYQSMHQPWSLEHLLNSHVPVKIGTVNDRATFSRADSVSVLNMPIKMPGTDYRIPAELAQYREFLQKIIDHEAEVNPRVGEFFAYFTVDQSVVKGGTTHRRGGVHIDGVQGARYPVKLPPEHTYSASDTVGTTFYDQTFDLRGLDPARQHVHAELERQAKPENKVQAEDYEIYFWDSYSVHEASVSDHDAVRTFLRVEFSKKIYDSVGDTRSPLFDYDWIPVSRPIPENLDDRPLHSTVKSNGSDQNH